MSSRRRNTSETSELVCLSHFSQLSRFAKGREKLVTQINSGSFKGQWPGGRLEAVGCWDGFRRTRRPSPMSCGSLQFQTKALARIELESNSIVFCHSGSYNSRL
jgi:hypothetical protein